MLRAPATSVIDGWPLTFCTPLPGADRTGWARKIGPHDLTTITPGRLAGRTEHIFTPFFAGCLPFRPSTPHRLLHNSIAVIYGRSRFLRKGRSGVRLFNLASIFLEKVHLTPDSIHTTCVRVCEYDSLEFTPENHPTVLSFCLVH